MAVITTRQMCIIYNEHLFISSVIGFNRFDRALGDDVIPFEYVCRQLFSIRVTIEVFVQYRLIIVTVPQIHLIYFWYFV